MASIASPHNVETKEVIDFFQMLKTLATHASATCVEKALKENKELKGDNDALIRSLANLQVKLDGEVEKAKDAITQSNDAKAKAGALTSEIEGAKQTIADKDRRIGEDASTITGLRGTVEALGNEVKTREEEIKKHLERQEKDASRITELDTELKAKKTELEATSNQLKELQELSCKVVDGSKEFV